MKDDLRSLVSNWENAVGMLWKSVIEKAMAATVSAPHFSEKFGVVTVTLDVSGIHVTLGSQGIDFPHLLRLNEFSLSEIPKVRKFVSDSIHKGMADTIKAVKDREDAIGTAFEDLKKDIAEWNLICPQGKEIK